MTLVEATRLSPERWRTRAALVLFSVICALVSLLVDVAWFDRTFLREGPPDWHASGFLRMGLSLLAGMALASALIPDTPPRQGLHIGSTPARLALSAICLAAYGIHLWAAHALLNDPQRLMDAVEELGAIALMQEAAIACALGFLVLTAARGSGLRTSSFLSIPARWIVMAMTLAVLLLLLEETSYGQHYFGWATPEPFKGNSQQETNLHNFYTIRFEMVYYGVAFIAFIAMPLLRDEVPARLRQPLDRFVPPADFALLAMPLVAGMYASWNIMPQQVMFMAGILVLATVLWRRRAVARTVLTGLAALAVLLGCQFLYLVHGDQQVRLYEVAEIREACICFALLAYSIWFWQRNRQPIR